MMLPLEILAHIFEYLDDFDDLKSVTVVCKHWLKATQFAKVLRNYKVTFNSVTIGDSIEEQLELFAKSERVFSNIYFGNAKIKSIDAEFWGNWSDCITEITFDYKYRTPDLPGGNFVLLLQHTPRLKTLNLVCSLELFNTYFDELAQREREIVLRNIENVQELQMYFSEECLTKLNFGTWIEQMPKLKNIDFDVDSKKNRISEQAFNEILNFLQKHSTKVKGLHICDNSRALHKAAAEQLFAIKDMKVKALDLIINAAASKIFTDYLCTQSELQYLTINGQFSLSRSLQHMPKLKEIAISNGPALDGFKLVNDMKELESLGIAGLEFYDEEELDETYKMTSNPKLKELYLIDSTFEFDWTFVKWMCECFANLRLLNLDGAMIDDTSLVHIFGLKKLQELQLSNTDVTDQGFAGFQSRKKFKTANGQFVPMDDQCASISSLKELEVLNIDFCKRLCSHSFQAMQLKKLKHFSAQGSTLNANHIQLLAKNCPKIESLNLSKCYQIRENHVQAIMTLNGLETLELESCINMDLPSIKQMMKSNKLQTLNFSKCFVDVRPIAKEMFDRMKSLRTIILYKERLYRCNYVEAKC